MRHRSWRRSPLSGAIAACLILLPAPAAYANLLPPASDSMPIAAPSIGGGSVGTAVLTVNYTDTKATGTASAAAVSLGRGNVFRVDACVKGHSLTRWYESKCSQKVVDTRANTATIAVAAPSVTAVVNRPPSTGRAYLSYSVTVSARQGDGSYKEVASSWPSAGLTKASVAIPALSASSASAPLSEGASLSTGATGGVNTGHPDSFCMGTQWPTPAGPGPGVSTTALGSGMPAYYEVGEPTGAFEGRSPVGVMLVIHGGGWSQNGAAMVAVMRGDADRWRARGWRTLNLTYRPCNASLADVQRFYDEARTRWGTTVPYCATGASAGGNLALLLAASRSTLACAIDEAGPTNGQSIKDQRTTNQDPDGASNGPRWVHNLLTASVGEENVFWWSPALFPIKARVLFAVAANDPYIPWAQGTELRDRMRANDAAAYTDLLQLEAGTTPWVHGKVASSSLAELRTREEALVAPLLPQG